MNRPVLFHRLLALLAIMALMGCASIPVSPHLGLQRTLFPGLAGLTEQDIEETLEKRVQLEPPLSASIVWLTERTSARIGWGKPLTDYQRTGILEAALDALRRAPIYTITTLPTVSTPTDADDAGRTLDGLRSAAARFQSDVTIMLETATAEDQGVNPFAIGYAGIITAPLFPGTDFAVAVTAEMCAMDVRTGVMLACTLGRANLKEKYLYLWGLEERKDTIREKMVEEAVLDAAKKLVSEIALRVRE